MDIRVCPDCGSEFQPHILECIDCGAATRPATDLPLQPEPAPPPERSSSPPAIPSLVPGMEAHPLRQAPLEWARDLSQYLIDHGVSCRVEPCRSEGCTSQFTVTVAPGDMERARELDHRFLLQEVPDAAYVNLETEGCPACGTPLGQGQDECPECGLVVAGADDPEAC